MITSLIIVLVITIITFFLAKITSDLIKKRDSVIQDEPFELTELSETTPTPTPVHEKKKSTRKPKTTK